MPDLDAGRPRKSTAPATAPSVQGRRRVLASIAAPRSRVWCTGVDWSEATGRGDHHGIGITICPYTGTAGEEDQTDSHGARRLSDNGVVHDNPFHLLLF